MDKENLVFWGFWGTALVVCCLLPAVLNKLAVEEELAIARAKFEGMYQEYIQKINKTEDIGSDQK